MSFAILRKGMQCVCFGKKKNNVIKREKFLLSEKCSLKFSKFLIVSLFCILCSQQQSLFLNIRVFILINLALLYLFYQCQYYLNAKILSHKNIAFYAYYFKRIECLISTLTIMLLLCMNLLYKKFIFHNLC